MTWSRWKIFRVAHRVIVCPAWAAQRLYVVDAEVASTAMQSSALHQCPMLVCSEVCVSVVMARYRRSSQPLGPSSGSPSRIHPSSLPRSRVLTRRMSFHAEPRGCSHACRDVAERHLVSESTTGQSALYRPQGLTTLRVYTPAQHTPWNQ
ncbi:uncharacterized protein B0H18DRAFT_142263 [Fomitopsis serialis]|uniref:uncharacterized protein n=1 Tax=Fomitopsis serialis TaxID=139415 RepID=UPI002007B215|nr:uncharacterized protein B0H18DRAFT_142263 [Neoantrodia serialis]KAH9930202.1 hypothetical protein B0H18DRAFT_142263 [Neoantrodia serialis]